jgi:signal recognition particle receptor subunit beta
MASINYASKEISCKIVFYGPGLSGKTTNLQYVHKKIPPHSKGELISLATDQDRTLFFDFLPVDIGKIHGFSTKFQLYTVPGQVYYNATRKLVLRGVDGLVFVADSQRSKMDENLESLENLAENLSEYGYRVERMPLVFQYNKRDLNFICPVEELQRNLNPRGLPYFEAVANKGTGVFDTLKCISKLVLDQAKRKELFPQREIKVTAAQKAQIEVDLSQGAGVDRPEAAVGATASSQNAASGEASATTAVLDEAEAPAETAVEETRQAQETAQPQGDPVPVSMVKEAGEVENQDRKNGDSTIISWSAGRSHRKRKSHGFFLLRWLGKLFK